MTRPWTIGDGDVRPEESVWDAPETDDEFDDEQFSRMGIDLPEMAKESARSPLISPRSDGMSGILSEWSRLVSGMDLSPELQDSVETIMSNDGNIYFGNGEPQGIDPEVAGFDDVDDEDGDTELTLDEGIENDVYYEDEEDIYAEEHMCSECKNPYEYCDCGSICDVCDKEHFECDCDASDIYGDDVL